MTLKHSFSDSLHHAQHAGHDVVTESSSPRLVEEMEPDEAREEIDDIYAPLISRHSLDAQEVADIKRAEHYPHSHMHDEARRTEVSISYCIFFILGACVLLPWESEIVASSYLRSRLYDGSFGSSFSSWISLAFTLSNLGFLCIANATQQRANLSHRISGAIVLIACVLLVFVISTGIEYIDANVFFFLLMFLTILLGGAASFLQSGIVALSARFGPTHLQAILSGQGGIGVVVAAVQFVAAYSASSPSLLALPAEDRNIRSSAYPFFLCVTAFALLGLVSHLILIRLPLYRLVIRAAGDSLEGGHGKEKEIISFRKVERKVRHLGIAVFYIFFITLSVFPSITRTVVSVNEGGGMLTRPELFVPLAFAFFAAGDWTGRAMPQFDCLRFTNWRVLSTLSFLRTLFIPLFLMCNIQSGDTSSVAFIQSDIIFIFLMVTFALSNGYLSTLIMLAAIVDESLETKEIEIAATILAFYLTSGLCLGSLISFGVRAILCGCNPFLN